MADSSNNQNRGNQAAGRDSDSSLRDELQREEQEAKGGIGDIAEDRNLSGSSSWLTEPRNDDGNRDSSNRDSSNRDGGSSDDRSRQ